MWKAGSDPITNQKTWTFPDGFLLSTFLFLWLGKTWFLAPSILMAKTKLNSVLISIRGRVGDLIYKHYSYGTVITRVPRMTAIKWSPAQIAHRQRVREAGIFYRAVLADPRLKKKFEAIAAKKKIPLPAATFAEFMQRTAKAPIESKSKAKTGSRIGPR